MQAIGNWNDIPFTASIRRHKYPARPLAITQSLVFTHRIREICNSWEIRPVTIPHPAMPSRGRHQSTSAECRAVLRRIEAMDGVLGVIIGRSYGGKSLGRGDRTGSVRIQRAVPGGLKGVTQSAKGLQEIFIRTEPGAEEAVAAAVANLD